MNASRSTPVTARRETRLLLVTLGLSALLLLALARFRFPAGGEAGQTAVAATQPLAQLAARATYDDLASIMDDVERRVGQSMLALEAMPSLQPHAQEEAATRTVPALRIRDDMAVVALEPDEEIVGIAGQGSGPMDVVARDEVRGLAVVRVPARAAPTLTVEAMPAAAVSSGYLAMVEASRGGPAMRPVYVGRLDPVVDVRWGEPLASLGGVLTAQAGSFVFTLTGDFIGLVVAPRGLPALVPASSLLSVAQELADGRSRRQGELGIVWQELTPPLARLAGTTTGVAVAGLRAGGSAEGPVLPGDVVQQMNGWALRSVHDAQVASSSVAPAETATLQVVRSGETLTVSITAAEPVDATPTAPEASVPTSLGLELRSRPDSVEVTKVVPGGAGEAAGLLAGDLISTVNREPVRRAATITGAWASAPAGTAWLLTVTRAGSPVIVALEKP